jgi:hypothetical protein
MMYRIPTAKPDDFKPEKIVHVIVTVERSLLSRDPEQSMNLPFTVIKPKESPPTIRPGDESVVEKYAEMVASSSLIQSWKDVEVSPLDIAVDRPCWVVIEIDKRIENWQFAQGERGLTTKSDSDRNCHLRHIEEGRVQQAGAPISGDGCRVLYFGVVARDGRGTPDASELFNFHTEFLTGTRVDGKWQVEKRLNVIFDPDIKNEGTAFPP